MVVLPLVALGFLGAKLVEDQAALTRLEVERGFTERLRSLDQAVQTIVKGFERELGRYAGELPRTEEPEVLREAISRLPRAVMVMIFDEEGRLVFPPVAGNITEREQGFLVRTRIVWERGMLGLLATGESRRSGQERGWLSFFNGGAQSFLWWRVDSGRVVAIEVSGVELMTELVTQLPDTPLDGEEGVDAERIVLADPTGQTVYQWGAREPESNEKPKGVIGLSEPLEAWTLKSYASESALPGQISSTLGTGLFSGLAGLGLALIAGAWLIWRARMRESQLAQQRVSFVNQVSHELKTPLTNIRMYAELLRSAQEDDEDYEPSGAMARHLAVIERESERLSRLIKNVLTFARGQENKLQLSRRRVAPDAVVRATLDLHAPALEQARITPELALGVGDDEVSLDSDVLEQIMTNLLSNVEKYARGGGWVRVTTALHGRRFELVVEDRGPGIPEGFREKVFEPFWRMSDRLSEGVTGTGIGLDIARRLARLHGGDMRVTDGEARPESGARGARFEVELDVETEMDR